LGNSLTTNYDFIMEREQIIFTKQIYIYTLKLPSYLGLTSTWFNSHFVNETVQSTNFDLCTFYLLVWITDICLFLPFSEGLREARPQLSFFVFFSFFPQLTLWRVRGYHAIWWSMFDRKKKIRFRFDLIGQKKRMLLRQRES
jgi:hypothetical protein